MRNDDTITRYGIVISHIYAIVVGLLSYATFTAYLQNLGPEVFYKNVILAIAAFIAFGLIGYFLIGNAASMGKYLVYNRNNNKPTTVITV